MIILVKSFLTHGPQSRNEMAITRLRKRNSSPQGSENDQHEICPLNIIAL